MAIVGGMRTDSPHDYCVAPIIRNFYPEQERALKEMEEKEARIGRDEKFRHMADLYWATFEVMTKVMGKSDGDGYRAACDVIANYMDKEEIDNPDFHEILHIRQP